MEKIAPALVKAQKGFAPALKSSTNPHFKSRYADLAACIEAVIDSLNANGIALIQHTHECESGVTVETIFLHESGETLSAGRLNVPASKQDAQGYGSALTYARRYSLMAACGIAPEDDDGNKASNHAPKKPSMTEKAISDHIAAINASESLESLQSAFKSAWQLAVTGGDIDAQKRFTAAKDAKKKVLDRKSTRLNSSHT